MQRITWTRETSTHTYTYA